MRLPRRVLSLALLVAAVLALSTPVFAKLSDFVSCSPDAYYTIKSEHGETLALMAFKVSVGDYLVTEDNRGWKVVSVSGRTARAKFDRWVNLDQPDDRPPLAERVTGWLGGLLAQARGGRAAPQLGIYCTHSDEAYVPSTGKASLPQGDIYKVASTLTAGLKRNGFRVDQSFNNHNPHDGAAYHRSRRTVMELMRTAPAAIFDVHRDAIPDPNYYRKQVGGETIAQLRLVVGKQNQNRAVNFDFAKKLKAEANRIHPGLVKEIFWASGNYNQDVSPRAMLMEFGTHTNSEAMASRGAALMADVLPVVLTGKRTAAPAARPHPAAPRATRVGRVQNRSAGGSALWIALVVVIGGGIFLALNAGGLGGIGKQLKKFTGQELSGFLGRYRGRDKGREGEAREDLPEKESPREESEDQGKN